METINLVNTITKAVTPKVSNVAVQAEKVVAQKSQAASPALESKTGQVVPETIKSGQASVAQVIEDKVSELNDFVQNIQRGIQFSVHEQTGQSIITVTDRDTGDVIRSFPSEDILAFSAYIAENKAQPDDTARGLLVNERT